MPEPPAWALEALVKHPLFINRTGPQLKTRQYKEASLVQISFEMSRFSSRSFSTAALSFLSSRAYPDFLPRRTHRDYLCGSP
jgi:hypothetical protein